MRVLQLIDTLIPGGAERMAVTYANELSGKIEGSYICCTRKKGLLEAHLRPQVELLSLNKKSTFDVSAIRRLRKFIKEEKIDIVHAHSSSFFLASVLKMSGSKFKLVWHDHYGNSEFLSERKFKTIRLFSSLFDGIISVNEKLKHWALKELNCNKIIKINNFIPEMPAEPEEKSYLQGDPESFKIICVANLRPQKDLFTLISAFEKLDTDVKTSLHIIGEDQKTYYSTSILEKINNSPRSRDVFYYGSQANVFSLLLNADLGVLSSTSEGLPLALLEYGMAGLPVISTKVGECSEVVGETGKLVDAGNIDQFVQELLFYIKNEKFRFQDAKMFQQRVREKYSSETILEEIIRFYRELSNERQ